MVLYGKNGLHCIFYSSLARLTLEDYGNLEEDRCHPLFSLFLIQIVNAAYRNSDIRRQIQQTHNMSIIIHYPSLIRNVKM